MSNNKLFQLAGWACLLSVLLIIGPVLLSSGTLANVLQILNLLVFIFIFYAFYVAYRSQSSGLSLAGLVLSAFAVVMSFAGGANSGNMFFFNLFYILYSLPFLIFGYLATQSDRMPRGLAIFTLLEGALWLISGVLAFMGISFAYALGSISMYIMVIWLLWLWRVFLSKKFTEV